MIPLHYASSNLQYYCNPGKHLRRYSTIIYSSSAITYIRTYVFILVIVAGAIAPKINVKIDRNLNFIHTIITYLIIFPHSQQPIGCCEIVFWISAGQSWVP